MTSQNLSWAIFDLYARTIETRKVTSHHRRILMEAICSAALQEEERSAIDRLLRAVTRGRLQITDE